MAGIKVSLKGAKKFRARLDSVQEKTHRGIIAEVQKTALKIETDAKKQAPVDTGRLRSSIGILDSSVDGDEVAVGSRVEYAPEQERRNPFLGPAAEKYRVEFEDNIAQILRNL